MTQRPRTGSRQARQPRMARRRVASGLTRARPWTTQNDYSLSGFSGATTCSRVPSSPLFSGGPLLLVVFEPRLHEPVEFLELLFGVGFGRAVFQPTEHTIFDQVAGYVGMVGMEAFHRLLDRKPFPVGPDDLALLGVDLGVVQLAEDQVERLDRVLSRGRVHPVEKALDEGVVLERVFVLAGGFCAPLAHLMRIAPPAPGSPWIHRRSREIQHCYDESQGNDSAHRNNNESVRCRCGRSGGMRSGCCVRRSPACEPSCGSPPPWQVSRCGRSCSALPPSCGRSPSIRAATIRSSIPSTAPQSSSNSSQRCGPSWCCACSPRCCASTAGASWSATALRSRSAAARCRRSSYCISNPTRTPSPSTSWDTRCRP